MEEQQGGARRSEPRQEEANWRGHELFETEGFGIELSDVERRDLSTLAGAGSDATRSVHATPALDSLLGRIAHELEWGSGAVLLRGLVDLAASSELSVAFWQLALRLGTPVSQTADGDLRIDVQDHGYAPGDPRFRGPHSNRRLSFHTDRCDVIAFLCVRPAREGGENHVISSRVLLDELRRRSPDHAAVLERDALPYLRHTIDGGNRRPYTHVPVFTTFEGRFAASLLRVLIDRADASPDAPDLTDAQRVALDALEDVAEDPTLYATFRLEAGDVLLLNNWTTLHRRTAFVDEVEPERRRRLERVWLSMPNSRPLDPRFADHFGATKAGALRGGIHPPGLRPESP